MTNLVFALMAPFFVWFEVMNKMTGYKEEEKQRCEKIIHQDIAHYRLRCGYPMMDGIKLASKKE